MLQEPVKSIVSTVEHEEQLPHVALGQSLVSLHLLQSVQPLTHLHATIEVLECIWTGYSVCITGIVLLTLEII